MSLALMNVQMAIVDVRQQYSSTLRPLLHTITDMLCAGWVPCAQGSVMGPSYPTLTCVQHRSFQRTLGVRTEFFFMALVFPGGLWAVGLFSPCQREPHGLTGCLLWESQARCTSLTKHMAG